MALFMGSDYTIGVRGIGPVNAVEIINSFPGSRDFRDLKIGLILNSSFWISRLRLRKSLRKRGKEGLKK